MMMSFCRKITPHSLLGLTTTTAGLDDTTAGASATESPPIKCHYNYISSPLTTFTSGSGGVGGGLLGLVIPTANDVTQRQPLVVLESSSYIKPSSFPSSSSPPSSPPHHAPYETKKDPGGIGFIDDIGGGVDGLMSCTESLGFESSYGERRVAVDDRHVIQQDNTDDDDREDRAVMEEDACLRMMRQSAVMSRVVLSSSKERKAEAAKKFPPPLSSLNQNGQPRYYLRPVRRDGRLELTEVRIYRPEILRAYREDGRLRLHLISHDDEEPDLQEEEKLQEDLLEEVSDDAEEEEKEEEEEGSGGGEWKLTVEEEGWRCHNLVSRHHHHHAWSQQQHCVITR